MNYKEELKQLQEEQKKLISKLDSFSGQLELLGQQQKESEDKIKEYKEKQLLYKKSVELVIAVQKVTKVKIKSGFESIVTYALRYIYNQDYKFKLEFGKRGNLQQLDFNIETPDFKEAFNPLDTSGGGILDIISIALRVALLEISKPKIQGFIALDESFKHLSKNYIDKAGEFLNEVNKKMGRQIIMVTHQSKFTEYADKTIELG